MNDLRKKLYELEQMTKMLSKELFELHVAICKRLRQEKLDFDCCESDGELIFTVYFEDARKDCCDVTFGITADGVFRVVGKEWRLPAGKVEAVHFCLHDIYDFSSLKRVDPFSDDTNIFMAYAAQIDMLLQAPDTAAAFCLKMAEKVAIESFDADQVIFQLANPIHVYKENS